MEKKILSVFVAGLVLSGCIGGNSTPAGQVDVTEVNETFSGTLSNGPTAESFQLMSGPGEIVDLRSGNADLSSYVGQNVEVTGQFSGTTLYVDQVRTLP